MSYHWSQKIDVLSLNFPYLPLTSRDLCDNCPPSCRCDFLKRAFSSQLLLLVSL